LSPFDRKVGRGLIFSEIILVLMLIVIKIDDENDDEDEKDFKVARNCAASF
jgi:hypothetical protein